jgi:hypothetical protein
LFEQLPLQKIPPGFDLPQIVVTLTCAEHTPAMQTGAPEGHTLPQLPQLFASVKTLVHALPQ